MQQETYLSLPLYQTKINHQREQLLLALISPLQVHSNRKVAKHHQSCSCTGPADMKQINGASNRTYVLA